MADISMCRGKEQVEKGIHRWCPLRKHCHRFTATKGRFQSYFTGGLFYNEGSKDCEYFWPNEEGDKANDTK